MSPNPEKRSYQEEEAAYYIGMSRSFLRQSRMTGQLEGHIPAPRFIRVGNRAIRYLKEDLDLWLDQFPRHMHAHEGNAGKSMQNGCCHD